MDHTCWAPSRLKKYPGLKKSHSEVLLYVAHWLWPCICYLRMILPELCLKSPSSQNKKQFNKVIWDPLRSDQRKREMTIQTIEFV